MGVGDYIKYCQIYTVVKPLSYSAMYPDLTCRDISTLGSCSAYSHSHFICIPPAYTVHKLMPLLSPLCCCLLFDPPYFCRFGQITPCRFYISFFVNDIKMQQVFVIVDYVRTDFYRNLVLCNLLYFSIKVAIMSSSCANVAINTCVAEIRGFNL